MVRYRGSRLNLSSASASQSSVALFRASSSRITLAIRGTGQGRARAITASVRLVCHDIVERDLGQKGPCGAQYNNGMIAWTS
eukprot:1263928-Rhodomonas_salina.2